MQPDKQDQSKYADLDEWNPLDELLESHPQFNKPQLRWLLRHRKRNGLDSAVRKIGRKIYIHKGLFAEWILNKSE